MKVIIAGSRFSESDVDYERLCKEVAVSGFDVTEVVSGAASGIDKLGEFYAQDRGLPVVKYPAHWAENGKAAGPMRNARTDGALCRRSGSASERRFTGDTQHDPADAGAGEASLRSGTGGA